MAHLHHAPADCPVCGDDLIITRKGCPSCGTELAGEFASCPYCALDGEDLDLLKVFLVSRGNLREVEKHLGVSYPTARARFDAVVAKLGLSPTAEAEPDAEGSAGSATGQTAQEQILARVAAGQLSAEVAAELISRL